MPRLRDLILGPPLRTEQAVDERLSKPVALAILSSDALSSVAYATEEILLMLVLAGSAALSLSVPIALAIVALLSIVAVSYRQVIKAYPGGGGSYVVVHENLGELPALIAGASLLVDYILTVAVSISSGTANITSAFPHLHPYRVEIAVALVAVLALINLRGVKESGNALAAPTYLYVALMGGMIIYGGIRMMTGNPLVVSHEAVQGTQAMTLFLILKAFASGCTAMTGTEAIATAVPLFRQPEARNARTTLAWMAGVLSFLFIGITMLARATGVQPSESETIVSQLSHATFGAGPLYFALQASVAIILVLAANTAFAAFPRLGSFMAADDYLPRQLKDLGSRLVHTNGVVMLAGVAAVLIIIFSADTHLLIPLYAIGVFTSFTLSQTAMVVHWRKVDDPGRQWSLAVNATGAVVTFIVTAVIIVAKFQSGAKLVLVLLPALVFYFLWVKRHYDRVAGEMRLTEEERLRVDSQSFNRLHNHVVLLVSAVDKRMVRAIQYAKSLRADKVEAIFVDVTGRDGDMMRAEWDRSDFGLRLTIISSPYRQLVQPIRDYVRSIPRPTNDYVVTVILPEFVPVTWPEHMLHDQTPFLIKTTLFREPGVIVTDVPYRPLHDDPVG